MGRSTNEISMVRRSLMDKGLIQSTGFGELSFTAPVGDPIRPTLPLRSVVWLNTPSQRPSTVRSLIHSGGLREAINAL